MRRKTDEKGEGTVSDHEERTTEEQSPVGQKKRVRQIIVALVIAAPIIYFTAPWFHWLWFGFIYMNLGFWILLVIAVVAFLTTLVLCTKKKEVRKPVYRSSWDNRAKEEVHTVTVTKWTWPIVVAIVFGLGIVSYIFLASSASQSELASGTKSVSMGTLPDTTSTRWLPFDVAKRYIDDRINDSKIELGDIDSVQNGSRIDWVQTLEPNKPTNVFTEKMKGVAVAKVASDGTMTLEQINQAFRYGEGMMITDNIIRQIYHRHYWIDVPEVFYVVHNGELIGVAPYMKFELGFRFPFLVQVPKWGGDFIIHQDGRIEDLTPQQAMQDVRISGQRLYPEELARRIGKAQAYSHGILNRWTSHTDVTKFPDVPDSENEMPFLLPTNEGPQWFMTLTPYKGSGIAKMMFINAHSGEVKVFKPTNTDFIGMGGAASDTKSTYNGYPWSSSSIFEPRPVFRKGTLYWMLSVTDTEKKKVSFTTLINAKNSREVRRFDTPQQLEDFLTGKAEGQIINAPAQSTPSQSQPSTQPQPSGNVSPGQDLSKMTDAELTALINRLIQEDKQNAEQLQNALTELIRRQSAQPAPSPAATR